MLPWGLDWGRPRWCWGRGGAARAGAGPAAGAGGRGRRRGARRRAAAACHRVRGMVRRDEQHRAGERSGTDDRPERGVPLVSGPLVSGLRAQPPPAAGAPVTRHIAAGAGERAHASPGCYQGGRRHSSNTTASEDGKTEQQGQVRRPTQARASPGTVATHPRHCRNRDIRVAAGSGAYGCAMPRTLSDRPLTAGLYAPVIAEAALALDEAFATETGEHSESHRGISKVERRGTEPTSRGGCVPDLDGLVVQVRLVERTSADCVARW